MMPKLPNGSKAAAAAACSGNMQQFADSIASPYRNCLTWREWKLQIKKIDLRRCGPCARQMEWKRIPLAARKYLSDDKRQMHADTLWASRRAGDARSSIQHVTANSILIRRRLPTMCNAAFTLALVSGGKPSLCCKRIEIPPDEFVSLTLLPALVRFKTQLHFYL